MRCQKCGRQVTGGDLCEECIADLDAQAEAEAEHASAAFRAYQGDSYLTDSWRADGLSLEEAKAEVQDPRYLRLCLEFAGLEYILKDRWATAGLLKALLEGDQGVLFSLCFYAEHRKPKKKRGPKPDTASGKYKYQQASELRAAGLSLGKVARKLYGDPSKANRVAALISQGKKRALRA